MPPWQAQRDNERTGPTRWGARGRGWTEVRSRSVRCWGHPTRDRDPAVGGGGLLLSCLSGCRFGSPSMPVSKRRCHLSRPLHRAGASGRSRPGRSVRRSRPHIGRGRPAPARPGRRAGPPRQRSSDASEPTRSTTTGNGRRLPSGLMPPTTYPVARSAAAGSARTAFRPPQASARRLQIKLAVDRDHGEHHSLVDDRCQRLAHALGRYAERRSRVSTVAGLASRSRPWRSGAAYV